MEKKFLVICGAILLLVVLFWTRYQVVPAPGPVGFYKINRLTGEIYAVEGRWETKVVRKGE